MINYLIKNNLKIILAIVTTAIICITGTAFATGYWAKDISYTKEGTNIKNVEEALNDLYLKKQIIMYKLGSYNTLNTQTIDISNIFTEYKTFTKDNFIISNANVHAIKGYSNVWIYEKAIKEYDSATGILTLGQSVDTGEGWGRYVQYDLYLIKGNIVKVDN